VTSNYVRIDSSSRELVVNTAVLGGFNDAGVKICITCNSYITGDVSHNNILIKTAVDCSNPISAAAGVSLISGNQYELDYNGGTRIEYNDAVTQTEFG